jgi:ribosomal protein S12 methylthiotransferase accessory factor
MLFFGPVAPEPKVHCDGVRSLALEETIARVLSLKTLFGITRIANLTGLDRTGVPVVMVCRPNSRSSAVFHGKGTDIAAAKASGLMEAVETWHAEMLSPMLRFGSFVDLGAGLKLINLDRLPRSRNSDLDFEAPMFWAEGRNLVDGEAIWVPFELVHANSTVSAPPASGCFVMSTNGLASGNHIWEAISHGLCEVIERDGTSLWRRSSVTELARRRLDLSTIDDPKCLDFLDLLTSAQLEIAVWDITSDIGAPAFQCLVADRFREGDHVGVGAACHPRRATGLLRAITEAAQVRTTYIVGSREDIDPTDYDPAILARRNAQTRALMRSGAGVRDFKEIGTFELESFEAEVDWLVQRLQGIGLRQVVAFDLTRPELAIPVVRVVVPGLEGDDHHSNYTPGARAQALLGQAPWPA